VKRSSIVVCVLLFALLISGCASQQPPASEGDGGNGGDGAVHLRFAGHDIGGTAYTQAAVLSQLVRPSLPKGSTIDVLPYAGGIGNISLIEDGEAEFGSNISVSDRWAHDGTVIFDKKYEKLRSIAGGTDTFYLTVGATKASGITSLKQAFEEKKPVRLMTLTKGSTGEVAVRHILEGYGVTFDDIRSWGGSVTHTSFANIQTALKDGHGDIVIHGVGLGHPGMTEIALTCDLNFLPLDDSVREMMCEKYGYDMAALPANTFKGQTEDTKTVAYYVTIAVSSDVSDDVAYLFTKTMVEKKADLEKGHSSFKAYVPEEGWKIGKIGAPLHPGAEKYYREKGWIK
jgi:TRAP transporter TAXI family solute receptor